MTSIATGVSRRGFLRGGLAAFGLGAFGGGRLFAAPAGWTHPGKANIAVGVVSDTHLITDREGRLAWSRGPKFGATGVGSPDRYFVAALEYFRSQNVDAVIHCGDMADSGLIRELEATAEAWRRVFSDDRAPDGHKVEKLFVTGNHDEEGGNYSWVRRIWTDRAEREGISLLSDVSGHWERIWGEKYEPVWHKVVKGYHFFGRHWMSSWPDFTKMVTAAREDTQLPKPFFMLSHSQDGKDDIAKKGKGEFKASLLSCRNAVAFCGHWHQSLTNWNMIQFWVNDSLPEIRCPSCAPFGGLAPHHDGWLFGGRQVAGASAVGDWRQGLVMRVYDDMIVFERREFSDTGTASLGHDWILPLEKCKMENVKCKVGETAGVSRPHPFSRDELKKVIGEPQFRAGAKLFVEREKRVGVGVAVLLIRIPLADGNPDSRVYAYEVVATGESDATNGVPPKFHKFVYASGCNVGIGHEPKTTTLEVMKSELPPGGVLTFAVRPVSSLGTSGKPLVAKIKVETCAFT